MDTANNPLPGIPSIESPFFDQFFDEKSCDADTSRVARDLQAQRSAVIALPDGDIPARGGPE